MTEPDLDSQTPSKRENADRPETAILTGNNRFRRSVTPTGLNNTTSVTASTEQQEVILVIRGMIERLFLADNLAVILGRIDVGARSRPDVDLTPYGALDRGVSRAHARLHMEGKKLYVTDLGSTNGTFVAGKRLDPNQPEVIRKGDELLLGRLTIQVLFK
jgi:pSer/pThr/pTyr-binding forkhead associated (FHA) protein